MDYVEKLKTNIFNIYKFHIKILNFMTCFAQFRTIRTIWKTSKNPKEDCYFY